MSANKDISKEKVEATVAVEKSTTDNKEEEKTDLVSPTKKCKSSLVSYKTK